MMPVAAPLFILAAASPAAALPTSGHVSVDLTSILVAIIGGAFTVILAVATALVNSHLKNAAAREIVDRALANALGAVQRAAQEAVVVAAPELPGVPTALAPGVQYVLDNAGDEVARLGLTPESIANKVSARIGLLNIQSNLAVTASAAPGVATPLAPVQQEKN